MKRFKFFCLIYFTWCPRWDKVKIMGLAFWGASEVMDTIFDFSHYRKPSQLACKKVQQIGRWIVIPNMWLDLKFRMTLTNIFFPKCAQGIVGRYWYLQLMATSLLKLKKKSIGNNNIRNLIKQASRPLFPLTTKVKIENKTKQTNKQKTLRKLPGDTSVMWLRWK